MTGDARPGEPQPAPRRPLRAWHRGFWREQFGQLFGGCDVAVAAFVIVASVARIAWIVWELRSRGR